MILKKFFYIVVPMVFGLFGLCLGDELIISEYNSNESIIENKFENDGYGDFVTMSGIKLPWADMDGFEGDEPVVLLKNLLNKIIEYSPIIIFVMLLLGCFTMIMSVKDGPGEKGKKMIKQVVLGAIFLIISVYLVNLLSIFLTGAPLIRL